MTDNTGAQSQQPPLMRSSALNSLDVLVGTWKVSGEAHGQVTFEWMQGGRFLIQHVVLETARVSR
jgi:hypothetical protein